ncbi:MAG: PHP domain-containing protein [bacterium]
MRNAAADLRRIAFLLERALQPTYRVRAFRAAAERVDGIDPTELQERAEAGTLQELPDIGAATAAVITESVAGREPAYLRKVEAADEAPDAGAGADLLAALRGDLHSHSDWSDGGSPIAEMAEAARDLGHTYLALTDHSPRLTVARGLGAERLERQLDVVAGVNETLAPFRLLTGIEVDILEDGRLDQTDALLARVDVVVASVHSKLRMPAEEMTPRMVAAVANPHTDVLGHCTGRLITGGRGTRPESQFDAELAFAACAQFGVAVEINSRPERLDPPRRLLRTAVEIGCLFSIDTDAHAPGQLQWQAYGCARAAECGVDPATVVDTWPVDVLLAWCADHSARP